MIEELKQQLDGSAGDVRSFPVKAQLSEIPPEPRTIPESFAHICAQLDDINRRIREINDYLRQQQQNLGDVLRREQRP